MRQHAKVHKKEEERLVKEKVTHLKKEKWIQ